MATAEAETSQDERGVPGGLVYDGFISYSHAADDLLAPRLQAGLQRFGKPWWKRRALRIFRDESSLSANPHLWSSITDALDQSAWFVLLLSPDAAESPWVNNEVEYWLEHKDPDRIIPVLTDGDFGWADGDVTGDAVPAVLQGAFSDEPRWVDLRFARTEEQLDLKNPAFSAAVADVASALRGVPKDELESEEVRQHRRTTRTAWGAGVVVLVLALAAGGAALAANAQRIEADEQRTTAEDEKARADIEADRATAAAADAEQQAQVAKSRELASSAVSVLDENPELAILLALESIHTTPAGATTSPSGVLALRDAVGSSQLLERFPIGAGESFARISPDGSTVYVWYPADGSLSAIDVGTGSPRWVHQEDLPVASFGSLGMSPDGELLAIPLQPDNLIPAASWDGETPGDRAPRIVVLHSDDGRVEVEFETACPWHFIGRNGFSPDGRYLMVQSGDENCRFDPSASWTALYETENWQETHRLAVDGEPAVIVSFSEASDLILMNSWEGRTELRSFPELELITNLGRVRTSRLSPDGTRAILLGPGDGDESDTVGIIDILRPRVVDVATRQQLFFLDAVDDFSYGDDFLECVTYAIDPCPTLDEMRGG